MNFCETCGLPLDGFTGELCSCPAFEIAETTERKQQVAFEIDAIKAIILTRLNRTEFHAIPQDALNDGILEIIARLSIEIEDLKERVNDNRTRH